MKKLLLAYKCGKYSALAGIALYCCYFVGQMYSRPHVPMYFARQIGVAFGLQPLPDGDSHVMTTIFLGIMCLVIVAIIGFLCWLVLTGISMAIMYLSLSFFGACQNAIAPSDSDSASTPTPLVQQGPNSIGT